MASTIRIFLALLVCLALVALIVLGRWRTGPGVDPDGSAGAAWTHHDCRQCHPAVWREWEQSYHSRAFSDPNVQAAFQHFRADRKCHTCHAPRPVLATGIGEEVQLRQDDRNSGVNCLSCHGTPEGQGVAARRTVADAPCRPVARPELGTSRICGTCHDAIFKDWRASRYRVEGKTCQDCHLPAVARRDAGRSHLCLGGHDPDTVRSGVRLSCRQQGDELIVRVTNHATGHNFPGERHNRILLVRVVQRNNAGEIMLYNERYIKQITPFRGESSADEIRAGETFEARFPVVEPPVAADVRLLYRAFPWYSTDEKTLIVHQKKLNLEKP